MSGQAFIAQSPELWIFIADDCRNREIAESFDVKIPQERLDVGIFLQAMTDALLMAQTAAIAIESLDMGSVFLGSILNDPRKIIEICQLPPRTMPVVGLAWGPYDHREVKKPKLGPQLRVFHDAYTLAEDYGEHLSAFNELVEQYYAQRSGPRVTTTFFEHITHISSTYKPQRNQYFKIAEERGFRLL
ncbi:MULTISPECIES: hypothetical protein [unclassified Corynebacterium]|uniref:hypothetical protein n=1 Tax=unclassified Corynebacterium TaxID=2624378 RepID=UPI0021671BFA|nr:MULTISPECIES: hypothetical protein [unclassified Corynebacterium]MCS4489910.1 hypothetical protein [Corynebacterium sp. ES2775-CONJ]MCS4491727.1 hypothetical protein [Corynebacterium sp. ES2715-CONJ3]MCS4531832.1 hypothetical protein [Corynebacterium sp. ES2730-CONJ]